MQYKNSFFFLVYEKQEIIDGENDRGIEFLKKVVRMYVCFYMFLGTVLLANILPSINMVFSEFTKFTKSGSDEK